MFVIHRHVLQIGGTPYLPCDDVTEDENIYGDRNQVLAETFDAQRQAPLRSTDLRHRSHAPSPRCSLMFSASCAGSDEHVSGSSHWIPDGAAAIYRRAGALAGTADEIELLAGGSSIRCSQLRRRALELWRFRSEQLRLFYLFIFFFTLEYTQL